MKIIPIILILLFSYFNSSGQLSFKSKVKLVPSSNNKDLERDVSFRYLKGGSVENLQRNLGLISNLPSDERILEINEKSVLVSKVQNMDSNKIVIKKYSISGNRALEDGNIEFASNVAFAPFSDGAFAMIENDEGGGKKIQLYSSELNIITELMPFRDGFDRVLYSGFNDLLLLGVMPINGASDPKLLLVNSEGKEIFNVNVGNKGEFSKLLCSESYFAVYCYDQILSIHNLLIYNRKGELLWEKKLDGMVDIWRFTSGELPNLIIGTLGNLIVIETRSWQVVDKIRIQDIYSDANLTIARKDNYIEVVAIEPLNNHQVAILLAEPSGYKEYINVLLYAFKDRFSLSKQYFKVGNSRMSLILKSSERNVMVINDNEVLNYEFGN